MKKVLLLLIVCLLLAGCSFQFKREKKENESTIRTTTSPNTKAETKITTTPSTKEVSSTTSTTTKEEEIIGKTLDFTHDTVKITGIDRIKDKDGKDALKVTFTYTNKSNEIGGKGMPLQVSLHMNVKAYQNDKRLDYAKISEEYAKRIKNKIGYRADIGQTIENCNAYFILESNDEVKIVFSTGNNLHEKRDIIFKMK